MNDHDLPLVPAGTNGNGNGAGQPDTGLAGQLERLAAVLLQAPPTDDEGAAELAALLPAQVLAGDVVVVCWQHQGGATAYDLVRFDGTRVDDRGALREALVLLAMVESLEELADPLRAREVVDLLLEWQAAQVASDEPAVVAARPLADDLATALWAAVEQLQALERERADGAADVAGPRMATAQELEQLALVLRSLDAAWSELEQRAELWSQATHDAQPRLVGQLWTAIAAGRRGALALPVTSAIEAGRSAGGALADEVLGAG